jgi:hypothetical protein
LASSKGKGKGKNDMMNVDFMELMDIHLNQNDLKKKFYKNWAIQAHNVKRCVEIIE